MSKSIFGTLIITIFSISIATAQMGGGNKRGNEVPVLKEISGLEIVKSVFPEAANVEKSQSVWFNVVDAKGQQLGYAISSKPYSDGIIGYHNTTPVIIVTDKNRIIKKVSLLSHWETAAYVNKLTRQNFFNTWNGLDAKEASQKSASADAYSGATFTANAVSKNVEIVLKKAASQK